PSINAEAHHPANVIAGEPFASCREGPRSGKQSMLLTRWVPYFSGLRSLCRDSPQRPLFLSCDPVLVAQRPCSFFKQKATQRSKIVQYSIALLHMAFELFQTVRCDLN